jgi:hypothetical protein
MWFGVSDSTEKVEATGALKAALAISSLGILALGIVPGLAMRLAGIASKMLGF